MFAGANWQSWLVWGVGFFVYLGFFEITGILHDAGKLLWLGQWSSFSQFGWDLEGAWPVFGWVLAVGLFFLAVHFGWKVGFPR